MTLQEHRRLFSPDELLHFPHALRRIHPSARRLRQGTYIRRSGGCPMTLPPNRPIWFVIYPLWFVDTLFCISNTQQLLKIASISALFFQKPCTIQINVLPLQHQNPPSLSTML